MVVDLGKKQELVSAYLGHRLEVDRGWRRQVGRRGWGPSHHAQDRRGLGLSIAAGQQGNRRQQLLSLPSLSQDTMEVSKHGSYPLGFQWKDSPLLGLSLCLFSTIGLFCLFV